MWFVSFFFMNQLQIFKHSQLFSFFLSYSKRGFLIQDLLDSPSYSLLKRGKKEAFSWMKGRVWWEIYKQWDLIMWNEKKHLFLIEILIYSGSGTNPRKIRVTLKQVKTPRQASTQKQKQNNKQQHQKKQHQLILFLSFAAVFQPTLLASKPLAFLSLKKKNPYFAGGEIENETNKRPRKERNMETPRTLFEIKERKGT